MIMFDTVSMSEAAKWIALVFVAGFIGFFGKYLARTILSTFQKKKEGRSASRKPSGNPPAPHGGPLPGARQEPGPLESGSEQDGRKAFKKTLKAQEKAMKKQGKK